MLPFSARLDAWVMTSFWIDDDEVGVELQAGTIAIREPREVALYRDRFEALWRLGVAGDELVALVREIGRWLDGLSD